MSTSDDTYSRLHYRRFVAWPKRIEREWPLVREVLGPASGRRVLDLGCGTGEHSRFLAERGYGVLGIDRSSTALETARREGPAENPSYAEADLGTFDDLAAVALGEGYDGAICLGNTLPHLTETTELERFAQGLRRALRPGAAALIQLLNYERIFTREVRHLPLNFRIDEETGDELVFLRLMEPRADGRVIFRPSTLRVRDDAEPPLEVVRSKRVELRGWRRSELDRLFAAAGFTDRRALGGFDRSAYDPDASHDLLFIAR